MEKTKEFGGRTFAFGTIPATEAVFIEVAIAKVIGEPAFKALMALDVDPTSKKKKEISKEQMLGIAATSMGMLTSKMDPDELIDTMRRVFKYVSIKHDGEGERVDIDKHFTGRNKDLWLVFVHALRFNFSDFFPDSLSGSIPSILKG